LKDKFYVYIDHQEGVLNDLILYDLENKIIYGFFEEWNEIYSRKTIFYDKDPELYESYLTDYDENKSFPVSKEVFLSLKSIDLEKLKNIKDLFYNYSLEEWII